MISVIKKIKILKASINEKTIIGNEKSPIEIKNSIDCSVDAGRNSAVKRQINEVIEK